MTDIQYIGIVMLITFNFVFQNYLSAVRHKKIIEVLNEIEDCRHD